MQIDPRHDILGLIDVQPTFMPDGELPVTDGDAVQRVINRLLRRFGHAFATQDWHPAGHASFRQRASRTAAVRHDRDAAWTAGAVARSRDCIGRDPPRYRPGPNRGDHTQGISPASRQLLYVFFENDRETPTGLDAWLRQREFTRIFLCSLATDFCVAWSAQDAVHLGFTGIVIQDACRGIGLPALDSRITMDDTRDRLTAPGVTFIDSGTLHSV